MIQGLAFRLSSLSPSALLALIEDPSLHPPEGWAGSPLSIAVEAQLDGAVVGCSLSELYPFSKTAQIDLVAVHPKQRRRGIGRELFAFTEKILTCEEGVSAIELHYESAHPSTAALEKILAASGWSLGVPFLLRCQFYVDTFNPSWLHYPERSSPSFHFFSWQTLSPEDRIYLEYLEQQGRFLSYLSPLRDESSWDLETSVGLRREGKMAGWCLTRRADPSTLRYSSLYVDRDLLHTGWGIRLLAASIRLQKERSIPYALFEANVSDIDPGWQQFLKKRLLPAAAKIERIKRAFHLTAPRAGEGWA